MILKKIPQYLYKAVTDRRERFSYMAELGLFNGLSDERYLKLKYKSVFGKDLNLDDPQTFNEKLQWLKLHNRKPEYTIMVDKYKVRQYIADTIGEQYLIPLLGVWDDPDEIDFDSLPSKFVLKCNHNSGTGMCICKDKSKLDIPKVKRELRKGLKENYYLKYREWPYKDVPRRIIAEEYMSDGVNEELNDYKMMCFNSKVKATFVCSNRFSKEGLNITIYDTNWQRLPFGLHDPVSKTEIKRPKSYEEMVSLAERLSESIPFVRVDFYEVKGRPYFGELTFFHESGFEEFSPEQWDGTLGEWIKFDVGGGYLVLDDGYVLWIHPEQPDVGFEEELKDYKFYCFDGVVKFVMINSDRNTEKPTKADYFDRDFNWLDFTWGYRHADIRPPKPDMYNEMLLVAEKLSQGLPHVRVDLYESSGRIYFGELTFFDGSGFDPFEPVDWDYKVGTFCVLPRR